MANVIKILGQGTSGTIYTVPALKATIISTITIANSSDTDTAVVTVNVVQQSDSADTHNYILYKLPIQTFDSYMATVGITLAVGDAIAITVVAGSVAMSVFGTEMDL